MVKAPLVISGPNEAEWKLSTDVLRQLIVIPQPRALKSGDEPYLDANKLAPFVADIARDVDRVPVNARFQRGPDGSVQVLWDDAPGLTVNQSESVRRIAEAARGPDRRAALVVDVTPAAVVSGDADKIASLGFIADNSTSYVGSIPPRRHNVELATSLLNGVTIAPGEIFSFDHELGSTSLDRGFQVGYGILAQGDKVKTVPSVAGGICQVATTLFQPVFWEGYTIEERYSHAYWIAHYVSRGVVGLDTTVDEEANLDFRFKNDTASPILIQSSTDGSNVHFSIYGVAPKWTVKVDPPTISNIVKTDPKPILQPDPTLPKGQRIITEAAQDGFLVIVHRSVTDEQGNTRDLYVRSAYAPSHNVTLVGTKT
jgi:vancomycin resistance protein YoaR